MYILPGTNQTDTALPTCVKVAGKANETLSKRLSDLLRTRLDKYPTRVCVAEIRKHDGHLCVLTFKENGRTKKDKLNSDVKIGYATLLHCHRPKHGSLRTIFCQTVPDLTLYRYHQLAAAQSPSSALKQPQTTAIPVRPRRGT